MLTEEGKGFALKTLVDGYAANPYVKIWMILAEVAEGEARIFTDLDSVDHVEVAAFGDKFDSDDIDASGTYPASVESDEIELPVAGEDRNVHGWAILSPVDGYSIHYKQFKTGSTPAPIAVTAGVTLKLTLLLELDNPA